MLKCSSCLLLQLKRKDQEDPFISTATNIVEKYMEEFSKKHYDKIAKHFEISEEALKDVIHEILKLNPKPGDTVSDIQKSQQHITPDFLIYNSDGILELMLNSKNATIQNNSIIGLYNKPLYNET